MALNVKCSVLLRKVFVGRDVDYCFGRRTGCYQQALASEEEIQIYYR